MTPILFSDLGLSQNALNALAKKGFEEPTPIQAQCIPLLLKNTTDIFGQAQTGTGKTAAFGLPILDMVTDENKVQAIILAPTRELAIQVAEEIYSLRGEKRVRIATIYGGQSITQQMRQLREGVQIVVGTPGRVIDMIERKALKLDTIKFLVLDEADEMLNMGFVEDIEHIMKFTPDTRRTILFSATLPRAILGLIKKYMPHYEHVEIKKNQTTSDLIDQIYFEVRESNKFEALCRIIDTENDFYGLIFCRTKSDTDAVAQKLISRGYSAEGVHGDVSQNQREDIFRRFRSKKVSILIATDVAARGIDVDDLTHVINYSLPFEPESYTHRVGRTGRAGKKGTAITFVTPAEYRKLIFIQNVTKVKIRKGELPKIQDVIQLKKERVMTELQEIIEKDEHKGFAKLAEEMLKNYDAPNMVAALLKHSFSELDEKTYSEVSSNTSAGVDRQGSARLFIAMGTKDGIFNKQQLVEYMTSHHPMDQGLIRDIEIGDIFSLVSVPFQEAEAILQSFQSLRRGSKSIVTKATHGQRVRKDGDSGGFRRGGSEGRGGFRRGGGERRDRDSGGSRGRSRERY